MRPAWIPAVAGPRSSRRLRGGEGAQPPAAGQHWDADSRQPGAAGQGEGAAHPDRRQAGPDSRGSAAGHRRRAGSGTGDHPRGKGRLHDGRDPAPDRHHAGGGGSAARAAQPACHDPGVADDRLWGRLRHAVTGLLCFSTVRRLERDYLAERAEGEALAATLQENRILLDEVNHRVKNSLQIVANLLRTQAMRHRSAEVRQELLDSSSRVLAIAEVHRRLYGEGAVYDTVELTDLIRSIAENAVPPTGGAEPAMTLATGTLLSAPVDTAVPVALIVNELLTNSYKHAFPDGRRGRVTVDMAVAGNEVRIDVADDGIGLPEEVAGSSGGGFGLNTARNLTRQLRGRLEIERLTPGTRFLLTFPMKPSAPTQA
ncbi:hypothetical protein GBZ48_05175 [Azospirillum melinis]|uniref:histidine kinase n=1 Tax=Azospirillum melinis TaxID=328839 RepID=A0ABX2K873_9PROT|nr:hypothetical protein [Azospirillum melinis]